MAGRPPAGRACLNQTAAWCRLKMTLATSAKHRASANGTLLVLDETHTPVHRPGGHACAHKLTPDMLSWQGAIIMRFRHALCMALAPLWP